MAAGAAAGSGPGMPLPPRLRCAVLLGTAGTVHAGWLRPGHHRITTASPGCELVGIAARGADLAPVPSTTTPAEPLVRSEDDGARCS